MMEWPDLNPETYDWETAEPMMTVCRKVAEAAVADITQDHRTIRPKVDAFRERLENVVNWESEYRAVLEEFVELHASASSNEQAIDMAQAGLDAWHDTLLYRIDDHTIVPAKDAFVLTSGFPKLETRTLVGSKAPDIDFQFGLTNPKNLQDTLYGNDACQQVNAWHKYGVLETSAAVLAKTTYTTTNLPSIMSNKRFVLLGCTSELGPAKSLIQIPGATILGVARGGKKFDNLLDYVRYNAPDDTTFLYPRKGANLLTDGPQIAQWILDQTKPQHQIVLVPLAHMEGEAGIRVAVTMDLIAQRVMRQRSNTVLVQYTSPTQVLVLPPTAATSAQKRLEERPSWEGWTNTLTLGRWMKPSLPTSNHDYTILNGLITAQGSHFAMAKLVQQWRCMIAHYRDGHIVAAPSAPPTRTTAMTLNTSIASALEGMHHFEPMLAFDVGPASTLMAAVLISQIQFMNRPLPDPEENPFTMFWEGAVHGGIWTCPYSMESVSTINWALGLTGYYPKGYIPERALPPKPGDEEPVRDPEEVLKEMENSQFDQPMPDSVKERLDFL